MSSAYKTCPTCTGTGKTWTLSGGALPCPTCYGLGMIVKKQTDKPRPPRMRRHTAKKLLNKMRRKPVHVDLTTGRAASVMAFTRSARGL